MTTLVSEGEPRQGNAEFVREAPFCWYARWLIPGNKYWVFDADGSRRRWTGRQQEYRLGPFRYRWLARRAVKRSILR